MTSNVTAMKTSNVQETQDQSGPQRGQRTEASIEERHAGELYHGPEPVLMIKVPRRDQRIETGDNQCAPGDCRAGKYLRRARRRQQQHESERVDHQRKDQMIDEEEFLALPYVEQREQKRIKRHQQE